MTQHIGIGKEQVSPTMRLRFRVRTLLRWALGRSSIDGRTVYLPLQNSDKDT